MPKSWSESIPQSVIQVIAPPAAIAGTGYVSWKTLQALRTVPNTSNIKTLVSTASSTNNIALDGYCMIEFLLLMFLSGAWRDLNKKQLAAIGVLSTLALSCFIYTADRFGIEHNTGAAAIVASCSAAIFKLASESTKNCIEANRPGEEEQSLINEARRLA